VVRSKSERANPFKDDKNLITDPVFLIGNGKSREQFSLEQLRGKGTIIGCNALYRDFTPDVLIAIDAKLIKEIRDNKYHENNFTIIPHNRTTDLPGSKRWRTDKFNTSGCYAMKLISYWMQPEYCYMLGMDNYPGNVYDSTLNYQVNTLQNFSGVGNYYLKALDFSDKTVFVNVNDRDAWPDAAHATGRYKFITYGEFKAKVLA
jgi:hypothetical protein